MLKVAIIGAGSLTFTRRLLMDILAVPEFRDTEFRFMDINEENLEMATKVCRKMIDDNHIKATIISTLNRKKAIKNADYVLCVVRVGGEEAFQKDIEIPLKYGVSQCIGDTLGPGGIFYAMRTIPVLLDVAKDISEAGTNALLLNYSNPMAMNCWALRQTGGVKVIGLCHGVQNGHEQISKALNLPENEVEYIAAGINHQTWFIKVQHNGVNKLPDLLAAFENHPELSKMEPCRIDVLRRFGFYSTESNGHLSEYLPWYRKRGDQMERWIARDWYGGETGGYLREFREEGARFRDLYPKLLSGEADLIKLGERTKEHASYIIEALELGRTYRGHFNVENQNLITNLPNGCTIEIPCYVDQTGIHPLCIGDLPLACAATCRASVSVQEMAVEAALTGNKELVKQAVLHDPLTAAICTTDEIWSMCDEMFKALAAWMPQFE